VNIFSASAKALYKQCIIFCTSWILIMQIT
jgi:hypothetical protein